MAQIPRTFKYEPLDPGPRSFGEVSPRADFKGDLLLAASEALSGLGLGDQKEWYRRLGRGADSFAIGPVLDAASATANWLQSDDAPNPGLELAEALSGAMFVGPMAKAGTKPMLDFYRANQLADRGALNEELWNATGWFRGPDAKWRREIDDSGAQLNLDHLFVNEGSGQTTPMAEAITHPELFSAYPQLGQTPVRLGTVPGAIAAWKPGGGMMLDSSQAIAGNPKDTRGIFLHELQHGVQDIEKWAPGGNPQGVQAAAQSLGFNPSGWDAQSLYYRLFGEIEARDTQFRQWMDMARRRELGPYESQIGDEPFVMNDWRIPRIPPSEVIASQDDFVRLLEALRGNR